MWFLNETIAKQIEEARKTVKFDTEDLNCFLQADNYSAAVTIESKRSKVARIPIEGILTEKPDLFASLIGGGNTTYESIIEAVNRVNADKTFDSIELLVNSPGGNVLGMFGAMDAIAASKKPVKAIVGSMAASAAFGIVSQADTIEARDRASQVGSVGVAYSGYVYDNEVNLTSTDAPNKRPDLKTDEGKAAIKKELDDLHALFVESIAKGRGVDVKKVNSDFGRGGIVLARDALKIGMIDGIIGETVEQNKQTAINGGKLTEVRLMDLNTLKTEHPDVYAAAVEIGRTDERDRVVAHLTLGRQSGDRETADEAIENGIELNATIQAKYLAASMRSKAIEARQEDDPEIERVPEASVDILEQQIVSAWDKSESGAILLDDQELVEV